MQTDLRVVVGLGVTAPRVIYGTHYDDQHQYHITHRRHHLERQSPPGTLQVSFVVVRKKDGSAVRMGHRFRVGSMTSAAAG